jgi:hypothetical protein
VEFEKGIEAPIGWVTCLNCGCATGIKKDFMWSEIRPDLLSLTNCEFCICSKYRGVNNEI